MGNAETATISDYGVLRDAFAHAAPGMAIIDINGSIVDVNESFTRLVAREPADIKNTKILDLTHPADRSRHEALLEQLVTAKIPNFVIEKRYMRPDGSVVWVRNSVSLLGGKKVPSHLIAICEDINDRKRAESALETQDRLALLGRLNSSIIHEINNPLEAVINLIYLAQKSATLKEAGRYLTLCAEELARAASITAQALQFHREPTSPTAVDIAELMRSVLILFQGKFAAASIRANFRASESPHLICFPGEIRQVIANLISNSVDAMPEGGDLHVRVRTATDWRTDKQGVRVTVADTGMGISDQVRGHIYDAFYTTKGSMGSGLGLWVTANIVRKHEGSMKVRSKKVAGIGGTTFAVIFPYSGAQGKGAGFNEQDA